MAPAARCPRPWQPYARNEIPGCRQLWTPRAGSLQRSSRRTVSRSATATDPSTTFTKSGVAEGQGEAGGDEGCDGPTQEHRLHLNHTRGSQRRRVALVRECSHRFVVTV